MQSLFSSVTESTAKVFEHYFFLIETSRENDLLLLELNRLSKENNELRERKKYLERAKKLVEYFEDDERPFVIAKVIGYDATQWSKMIFINRGTSHKVEKNLTVMTDTGIVGHVIHSSAQSSKVLLITDSRSAIDSLFQETRISGVTVGTGEKKCQMKFVPISAEVNIGDKVISSGLGGVFLKGLVVGVVGSVVKQKQELFQDITIIPSVDLSNLEEVVVILPNKEGE